MPYQSRTAKRKVTTAAFAAIAIFSALYLLTANPGAYNHDELEGEYYRQRQLEVDVDGNEPTPKLYTSITHIIDPESPDPEIGSNAEDLGQDEAKLADMMNSEPTLIHDNPASNDGGVIVDVLSIGSESRLEYLTAQVDTWASHTNIRHFWGFTEKDDFNTNCHLMDDEIVNSYVQTCRSPKGWNYQVEDFVSWSYAKTHGRDRASAGWLCAQRRTGRALGWLQARYGDENSTISIPNILAIVDDDTSMDIDKVKKSMLMNSHYDRRNSYSGASITYNYGGFRFAYGGYGTFINKVAIEIMTQPIFCTGERKHSYSVCKNLRKNRVGEHDVFREGDSVFEIFYKYSALNRFCMHSDWVIGYMITYYSGGSLNQRKPTTWNTNPCSVDSVACHNQTPEDMNVFYLARA